MATPGKNLLVKTYICNNTYYNISETTENHEKLESDPEFLLQYITLNYETINDDVSCINETHDTEEFIWNTKNIKLLLELYRQRKNQFQDPKMKKKLLWTQIVQEFRKHKYNVTEDILDRKLRNLKKTYKNIKDNQKATGRGRITWEYYETFEDLFYDDQTINHGKTLGTMEYPSSVHTNPVPSSSREDSINNEWNEDLHSVLPDIGSSSRNSQPLSRECRSSSVEPRPSSREYRSPSIEPRPASRDSSIFQSSHSLEDNSHDELTLNRECTPDRDCGVSSNNLSWKNSAVRSKAQYQIKTKLLNTEEKRVDAINDLRKSLDEYTKVQKERNELLKQFLAQLNKK